MPYYYFQLTTPTVTAPREPRARELPDLHAALVEAQHAARAMIRTQMRNAPFRFQGSLDIQDEGRRPVARIMLADVARQIS
jgi:hypothetical protein